MTSKHNTFILISFSNLIFNTPIAYLYYIGIANFYLIFNTTIAYLNYIGVAKSSRDPFQESIGMDPKMETLNVIHIFMAEIA